MDEELPSRMSTPPPRSETRAFQGQDFPDLDVFKHMFGRGQVRSPKRLWYGSLVLALLSIIVFGISVGALDREVAGDLGTSSGVLGFAAAVGGIAAVLLNKGGNAVYTNLLYYYFIVISVLSISVPIACIVYIAQLYWYRVDAAIALLVFSLFHCGVVIFATCQIKDNSGIQFIRFTGDERTVDGARFQNMAAFFSRWNERDSGYFNVESPSRIKKNLRSERCLIWTLTLYQLLCGLMLIGLGIFNLIENKPTAVAITFAPFWNGPVAIFCSLVGFMALNRKTNGLGLTFLASSFLTFGVAVAFLVFVCIDIDQTIRCLNYSSYYCEEYVNGRDIFMFSLTYSGFALFLLFQLIFSFIGMVLLFYTICSCCRRAERSSDMDAPPSYVESSSNFDPIHQRY